MAEHKTLGAMLFEDFELLDLYGPLEMFGNIGPELKIVTITERAGPVRSAQGPSTVAEFGFVDAPALDLILGSDRIRMAGRSGRGSVRPILRHR
jgi:putative intracellular protease/amidase